MIETYMEHGVVVVGLLAVAAFCLYIAVVGPIHWLGIKDMRRENIHGVKGPGFGLFLSTIMWITIAVMITVGILGYIVTEVGLL